MNVQKKVEVLITFILASMDAPIMEIYPPNIFSFFIGTSKEQILPGRLLLSEVMTLELFRKNIFTIECCGNSIHFGVKITYMLTSIIAQLTFFYMRTALSSLNINRKTKNNIYLIC